MSFATLPPELLDAIFEPLSKPTLAALATTCSSFTACADRHLYRRLSLSSHARNLAAVHSLAARPLLASYVRTLDVDAEDDDVQGLCSALQQALGSLSALTSLELNVGTSDGWLLQGGAGGTFPDLHHFATSLAFDSNLVAFLLRTPALVSLSLSSPVSPMDVSALVLPTQAVPKLTQYTGPASLLRHLSLRPLTTLLLSDDLTLEDVQYLRLQGGPRAPSLSANTSLTTDDGSAVPPTAVQVLSAITSAPPALMIEALAKACPDLTCLRVMTTCAFWEAPDLSFYARIAQTLSTLPALAAFELSGMHWESRPKSPVSGAAQEVGEKEWVSPPVTPRVVDIEFQELQEDHDFGLNEAFLDWSY